MSCEIISLLVVEDNLFNSLNLVWHKANNFEKPSNDWTHFTVLMVARLALLLHIEEPF